MELQGNLYFPLNVQIQFKAKLCSGYLNNIKLEGMLVL